MTTLTLFHRPTPTLFARAAHAVAEFLDTVSEGKRIARRYEALSRLSDETLARRGLTRADIARAAVGER